MRPSARRFAIVLLVLVGLGSTSAVVEAADGRLHGVVADESGGVLPGVTVVATSAEGRVLASAVTDEVGRYSFAGLPAAPVRLTFQLEGFATAVADTAAKADGDSPVATLFNVFCPEIQPSPLSTKCD